MKKRIQDFKVIENKSLNKEYFVLTLQSSSPLHGILPGQFAEIRVDHTPEVFLRRPISFYKVDTVHQTTDLLIQKVGKGSNQLAYLVKGDVVNMIFPLGNTFSLPAKGRALIIGGRVGVAPLLFLGKYLKEKGFESDYILGFRDRSLLIDLTGFESCGRVFLTTDDGSAGEKGTVLDHSLLKKGVSEYEKIYTCGPEVMMKAVAGMAAKHRLSCEASLENTMACGFGACLCCVQKTTHGNLRVCVDGPVFNTNELIW